MINTCLTHLETRHQWRAPLFAALLLSLSACGSSGGGGGGTASTSGYTVSATASAGGSISQPTAVVNLGASASFTFTPDVNYSIMSVAGTCGGVLSGNTFTTDAIAANCTVEASFSANILTVNATYGTGGNISPASVTVNRGATTSFTVTPYLGFTTNVGGSCGGTLNGNIYTTNVINADCTVQASFDLNNYTISTSTSAGGGIDPASTGVNYGNTASFTLTPFTGYEITGVGGTCGGTLVGNTFTTASITASCSLVANFSLIGYMVTTSAGPGGNINPTNVKVTYGNTPSFTVTPNTGHSINSVGGTCGGTLNGYTYTTAAVTAACTVDATFVINQYTATASAGANGSIDRVTATIDYGTTTSFTVTPNVGYTASMGGTCGGTLVGNTYTIAAITANCTVVASFKLPVLTMTMQSVKTFAFSWANVSNATEYRLLENPEGLSGYTQIATLGAGVTSYKHVAFLPGRTNASYMLQACDAGTCADSKAVFVSGNLAGMAGYVKASNTGSGDLLGLSVALSADGKTLAVGAFMEDGSATDAGAVYVFRRSGTVWSQLAYIKPAVISVDFGAGSITVAPTGAAFGRSVALSGDGNTLAVGAPEWGSAIGFVSVYRFSGTTWSHEKDLFSGSPAGGNRFGTSLSLSTNGNALAVGEPGYGGIGVAYVFSRNGTTWSMQAGLSTATLFTGTEFGSSVALSANGLTLAVGAYKWDNNTGFVEIFSFSGTSSWSFQTIVIASNPDWGDRFGSSVALSADGNTLAVGAHGEDSTSTGIDQDGANDLANDSGAAYVFSRSGTSWSQQAYVKASNTGAPDYFGIAVTLSGDGNSLAVGAHGEDSNAIGIGGTQANESAFNSGAVYTFARSGTGSWSQQAYVKAPNTGANDNFGVAVTLSGDGNSLAVGAYAEGSGATGINGSQTSNTAPNAGAVYLY